LFSDWFLICVFIFLLYLFLMPTLLRFLIDPLFVCFLFLLYVSFVVYFLLFLQAYFVIVLFLCFAYCWVIHCVCLFVLVIDSCVGVFSFCYSLVVCYSVCSLMIPSLCLCCFNLVLTDSFFCVCFCSLMTPYLCFVD